MSKVDKPFCSSTADEALSFALRHEYLMREAGLALFNVDELLCASKKIYDFLEGSSKHFTKDAEAS